MPMRVDKFEVDMEVAWVPQALRVFLDRHLDELLQDEDLAPQLGRVPAPESPLMAQPADGTANAAVIESMSTVDPLK